MIAGGGSFLTLPALIFLGLSPGLANGTNRVGILTQNMAATWNFRRHGIYERRWAVRAAVPHLLGAGAGSALALWIDDQAFRMVLSILMVVMSLWTLWDPLKGRPTGGDPGLVPLGAGAWAGFFLVGIYGGFVQAGVGFLMLAVATLAGYDLVRGNSLKVFCVLISTPLSLAIFAWGGQVSWVPGLSLGAGMLLGGWAGSHLTVLRGHRWVKQVVTVAVIAMAAKLWFDS